MNINNSKGYVTNKGKKVLLKKAMSEKDNMSLKDLKIDIDNLYEKERSIKMS